MNTVEHHREPILQRASGCVHMQFKPGISRTTVLDKLYQQGCCKARFPRPENKLVFEAVLINTAGGLTDGDHIHTSAHWLKDTQAIVTSQAAERIYKSRQQKAIIQTELSIEAGARACWVPQETILFNGGRYQRETNVYLHNQAEFFGMESLVFGRSAMGESVHRGSVTERWKIHVDQKLVFTDAFHVDDELHGNLQQHLNHPAIANGASVVATLLYFHRNSKERLAEIRATIKKSKLIGGATCLGSLVVMRLLSKNSTQLRKTLIELFDVVHHNCINIPRVWNC